MTYGKSIKIFLIEGIAGGRWVCELSNWTGKTYKIPSTYFKASLDRLELAGAGIYFYLRKMTKKLVTKCISVKRKMFLHARAIAGGIYCHGA